MTEKRMQDLPPSYSDLAYDSESTSGPSAPRFQNGPPKFDDVSSGWMSQPSAPPSEPEPLSRPLVCIPPNLKFEDIYEACVQYTDEHCCYGKRFLNQMKLIDITNKVVFYYKLESFGEKRESRMKSKPYKGDESIDGPQNGQPPEPWDMTVKPPKLFKDDKVTIVVPHTDIVVPCPDCNGNGSIVCHSCGGVGNKPCGSCSGIGTQAVVFRCKVCMGSGKRMCWTCVGLGSTTCFACNENKRIKKWKVLNVTWKNHISEFSTEAGRLPNELTQEANGVELINVNEKSVLPVTKAPDVTINTASARLLETHNSFPHEKILQQRHILKAVPFTHVTYQWKQRNGEFYVYDTDKKVHFEDYPQSCCCICS